jgi:hypothetical protein
MDRIIYTRPDGGLSIIIPTISRDDPPGFTEPAALARAMATVPPDAQGVRVVGAASIPADRTYRDAWTDDGSTLAVDMGKARNIQRERLAARIDQLELSIAGQEKAARLRGSSAGALLATQRSSAIKSLNLSQLHSQIEAAATPDELKQVWPAELA